MLAFEKQEKGSKHMPSLFASQTDNIIPTHPLCTFFSSLRQPGGQNLKSQKICIYFKSLVQGILVLRAVMKLY